MAEFLDDESFFKPAAPAVHPLATAVHHRPARVKLDNSQPKAKHARAELSPVAPEPAPSRAKHAHAELSPVVAEQAKKMRIMLQRLEKQADKMRLALQTLEQPAKQGRRASDRRDNKDKVRFERRRADRREQEDPNQMYLFDQKFLDPQYAAPPTDLPPELDRSSVENFSISLAYGDEGFGVVGTTLIALAMTDTNGDGKIDHNDVYPDQTPVHGLDLDLNQLREGMMNKVRELVARFDTNGNGRIDGPVEAFAFLRHVAQMDLDVTPEHLDAKTGMITTESYIKAFGDLLHRSVEYPEGDFTEED